MWGWEFRPRRVLGIFVAADAVFLAELERMGEGSRFRVRQSRKETIKAPGPLWDNAKALAEGVMRLCMTYGLSYGKINICLPRDLFFAYEREFPPMERKELAEAVRWDMETNVPFGEGTYWTGYGRHDEKLELAALPLEYGQKLVAAMADAGLGVESLTMEPLQVTQKREGMRITWRDAVVELPSHAAKDVWSREMTLALYAALRFYYPGVGVEFLPKGEKARNARLWQTAGNAMLAGVLFILAVLFAKNLWLLSAADEQLDSLRQEYALVSKARESMARIAGGREEIDSGERILQRLSAERLSWYAVFSVLGASAADGVYLTEFDVQEDGALLCGGRAVNYAHLVAYMERMEQDTAVFREKPLLKESAANDRGEISFKIRMKF